MIHGEFVSLQIPSWDPMTQSRALLQWRPTGGPVNEGMPRQQATVPAPRHEKHSPSRLSLTALKAAHQARTVPELREEDLEETFVRGSGPGGQSVNKTENNVQLLHIPTGIRVSCHETRSLAQNRRRARRLIIEKLDKIQNPGLSKGELVQAKQRERKRQQKKKSKRKQRERESESHWGE